MTSDHFGGHYANASPARPTMVDKGAKVLWDKEQTSTWEEANAADREPYRQTVRKQLAAMGVPEGFTCTCGPWRGGSDDT